MDVFALTMRLKTEGGAAVNAAITSMRKAAKDAEKDMKALDKATSGLFDQFRNLATSLAAVAGGAAITNAVDSYAKVNNQLKLAASSAESFAKAQSDVARIANQTGQPIEAVAELYGKTARAAAALGLSQDQVAKLTQTVSQALIVSGSSASTASGGLTQLAQALSAGVVRAEEFNSIMEAMPALVQSIEKDLGLLPGQLRKFALEGKLSSDIFAQAMVQNRTVAEQFGKMVPPISAELVKLRNQFVLLVGQVSEASGVTALLTQAVTGLRNNLPAVITLIGTATAAYVAYRAAVVAAALASRALIAVETVASFLTLARAVRSVADAAALLNLATGGWGKLAAVLAAVAASVGTYVLAQKAMNSATKDAAADLEQQLQQTQAQAAANGAASQSLAELGKQLRDGTTKATRPYIEALVELSGLSSITRAQYRQLQNAAAQLTTSLNAGNLSIEQRVTVSKQLQAINAAIADAMVSETATLRNQTTASEATLAVLRELAGVAAITQGQANQLSAEYERLTSVLSAGNITLRERLDLEKQRIAIADALVKATVITPPSEVAAMERRMGQPTSTAVQARFTPPAITQVNPRVAEGARQSAQRFGEVVNNAYAQEFVGLRERLAVDLGMTLADALATGVETAIATGSIGQGFKALAQTLLRGLGDMMIQFGKASLIAAGFMDTIFKALAKALPGGAIVASLGMIAAGAALKGAAGAAFGGGGRAVGGAGSISTPIGTAMGGAMTLAGLTYGPTAAGSAATIQQIPAMNVTIIGPNDPSAQRQMQELMRNAKRRGEA